MTDRNSSGGGNGSQQRSSRGGQLPSSTPPRIQPAPTTESLDYSIYSSGEMSAEQYYEQHAVAHQYQEQIVDPQQQLQQQQQQQQQQAELSTVSEYQHFQNHDATPMVHEMHRKLLYLLSHPDLFSEAMDWQAMIDQGLDPSRPESWEGGGGNGIKSFDNEFEEQGSLATTTAAEEHKSEVASTTHGQGDNDTNDDQTENTSSSKYADQKLLIPPLPLQIFASDAEVVLPQALTASQLFGLERVTGIELEAAAGTIGLSQLFLRWLALMPEGDHMNVIDPPGLTVMRISGGRYRVTGAHRVVWRWRNKFNPSLLFATNEEIAKNDGDDDNRDDTTDFDFGDLVSMTIIDVFETDSDGKLLSYCPTFDNRAVHKTQEVTERLRKGASNLKEKMDVVARSPAGKTVNKAAGNFGKMSISAALAVGNIVKSKIKEEIHKHQHPEHAGDGDDDHSETSSDATGGEDAEEASREKKSASKGVSKEEGYLSEESTGSRQMEV